MTREEFFNMPTNKKTLAVLREECTKRWRDNDLTHVFFNSVCISICNYIYSRKCLRPDEPVTTKSIYNDLLRIKGYGYRKDLVLPF